jgi:hypothetical protein
MSLNSEQKEKRISQHGLGVIRRHVNAKFSFSGIGIICHGNRTE